MKRLLIIISITLLCIPSMPLIAKTYCVDPREKGGFGLPFPETQCKTKARQQEYLYGRFTLDITNKSNQDLTIAARYAIKPATPGVIGMPNPFIYKSVPAHSSSKEIHFAKYGGGQLGMLESVDVRAGYPVLKSFEEKDLTKKQTFTINQKDIEKMVAK